MEQRETFFCLHLSVFSHRLDFLCAGEYLAAHSHEENNDYVFQCC